MNLVLSHVWSNQANSAPRVGFISTEMVGCVYKLALLGLTFIGDPYDLKWLLYHNYDRKVQIMATYIL